MAVEWTITITYVVGPRTDAVAAPVKQRVPWRSRNAGSDISELRGI